MICLTCKSVKDDNDFINKQIIGRPAKNCLCCRVKSKEKFQRMKTQDPLTYKFNQHIFHSRFKEQYMRNTYGENYYPSYNQNDYFTAEYGKSLLKKQNGKCYYCACKMTLSYDVNDIRKMSVERINNKICHIKSNIVMACLFCNSISRVGDIPVSKRTKTYFENELKKYNAYTKQGGRHYVDIMRPYSDLDATHTFWLGTSKPFIY